MGGLEVGAGCVFGPAILRSDQLQGSLAAAFILAGSHVERLVEQDGDDLRLMFAGLFLDFDLGVGMHARAERGDDDAIDAHPAVFNPLIGFAS